MYIIFVIENHIHSYDVRKCIIHMRDARRNGPGSVRSPLHARPTKPITLRATVTMMMARATPITASTAACVELLEEPLAKIE